MTIDLVDIINIVPDTLFIIIKEDKSTIKASTPPLSNPQPPTTPPSQILNYQTLTLLFNELSLDSDNAIKDIPRPFTPH